MSTTEICLEGTEPLPPTRRTAFYDAYVRQYDATVAWLRQALARAAVRRDAERGRSADWLDAKRCLLADLSGAARFPGEATGVDVAEVGPGVRSYAVHTSLDVVFAGRVYEPASASPIGTAVVHRADRGDEARLVASYLSRGCRVMLPSLAQATHSLAEDPKRKWIFFGDDELIHLFAFVVGGSLAGLEAVELGVVVRALAARLGAPSQTSDTVRARPPVVFDLGGDRALTAALAAALDPDLVSLLVLHNDAGRLDHQEDDARVNTIWGYHVHFDSLTLLGLANRTDLLFVEESPTPSNTFARAKAWLSDAEGGGFRRVDRLVGDDADAAEVLGLGRRSDGESVPAVETLDEAVDYLYRGALESKLSYLEAEHARARRRREARYELSSLAPDEYRRRVAESLERALGPALPEAGDRRPRTRLVDQRPTHAVYEVILESVPGIEVAGYFLLPTEASGAAPRPAVICQHGLGGRPEGLIGLDERLERAWVYDRFAERLAVKGYVVFVPFMNWGWPTLECRDGLVKLAYALGVTPNRFEVAQLHAVVDFLASRPEVRAERIAFYGLSYGGHASLWLGACEPRLAAVVTAGHFNEWQKKLTSTSISPPQERPTSFISVDEGYDMFNYDVLNQLGHAELATRFAPRPYLVENGLRDTVTPTAWVEEEFDRVSRVFEWLGASDRAQLAHFDGPHRVWSEESFQFLHRHLGQGAT